MLTIHGREVREGLCQRGPMTNNEIGNAWALFVLGDLAEAWPRTRDYYAEGLIEATSATPEDDVGAFLNDLFAWMKTEGFIDVPTDTDGSAFDVSITSKGLDAIGRKMNVGRSQVGATLKRIAGGGASEVGRSAIAETMGLLIGAAAKGLAGS